jgi:hypothetical protein
MPIRSKKRLSASLPSDAKKNCKSAKAKARSNGGCSKATLSRTKSSAPQDWWPLRSGEYKGKTIPEVLMCQPEYIFHALKNRSFDSWYWHQATIATIRMAHMVPPRTDPHLWLFAIQFKNHNFWDFKIIKKEFAKKYKKHGYAICKHLDLSLVSKGGEGMNVARQRMISRIKDEFFGDNEVAAHKSDINAFLSDASNFSADCARLHCPKIERWDSQPSL